MYFKRYIRLIISIFSLIHLTLLLIVIGRFVVTCLGINAILPAQKNKIATITHIFLFLPLLSLLFRVYQRTFTLRECLLDD